MIVKKYVSLGFIAYVFVAFLSCKKDIKVTPPLYNEKPSIQCFIEPDSIPHLYLNRVVPYFDASVKKDQLIIRDALVMISTGSTTDTLTLDSAFNKLDCQYDYFYRGSKTISINRVYTLSIKCSFGSYSAVATTDITPPHIDSIVYTAKFNDVNGEHEGVIAYFQDNPSQENYYRYDLLRTIDTSTLIAENPIVSACLGSDSILLHEIGRAVYKDAGLQGKQLIIVAEPAFSHKKGLSGLVSIQAIDRNAYIFFDQLDRQKLAANNPFVEPVFILPGQFGDKAIGFFSAKINSMAILFTYPE